MFKNKQYLLELSKFYFPGCYLYYYCYYYYREEYEKALSEDETTKELVTSYDKQVDEKALV